MEPLVTDQLIAHPIMLCVAWLPYCFDSILWMRSQFVQGWSSVVTVRKKKRSQNIRTLTQNCRAQNKNIGQNIRTFEKIRIRNNLKGFNTTCIIYIPNKVRETRFMLKFVDSVSPQCKQTKTNTLRFMIIISVLFIIVLKFVYNIFKNLNYYFSIFYLNMSTYIFF